MVDGMTARVTKKKVWRIIKAAKAVTRKIPTAETGHSSTNHCVPRTEERQSTKVLPDYKEKTAGSKQKYNWGNH